MHTTDTQMLEHLFGAVECAMPLVSAISVSIFIHIIVVAGNQALDFSQIHCIQLKQTKFGCYWYLGGGGGGGGGRGETWDVFQCVTSPTTHPTLPSPTHTTTTNNNSKNNHRDMLSDPLPSELFPCLFRAAVWPTLSCVCWWLDQQR